MGEWGGAGGKRILITGATRGIGLAAARELARRGASLVLVARDEARGEGALRMVEDVAAPGAMPDLLIADLASQSEVRRLAAEVQRRWGRLDVLVNNAGAMFTTRRVSVDGIEMTWALNHLAPFLLTNLLLERLRGSAPSRIVTTASAAHLGARVPYHDLNAEHSYTRFGFGRYGESKLANILFTRELARRVEGTGVTANCYHPGLVGTGFNHNNGPLMAISMALLRPFARSPVKGAETLVWLCDSEDVSGVNGEYFYDRRRAQTSAAAADTVAARWLWKESEEQTGLAR